MSNHQKRTSPFKLTRVKTEQPSWDALARLSLIRREELDGFIEGLFAGHDEIDLPEKAYGATNILGELRAMIAGVHELATTKAAPTDVTELEGLAKQIRELSIIAEKEINVAIQSCKRARAHMLETYAAEKTDAALMGEDHTQFEVFPDRLHLRRVDPARTCAGFI